MTAPKICPDCGAALDPGEVCGCTLGNETAESAPCAGGLEFVMGTDLDAALPRTIDFNFEELKRQLAARLEIYSGLVVTESDIKGAKADRAKLNALRTALEDHRKDVKRRCMAPYASFEAKVKELTGLIDKPIAVIDGQLRRIEEGRRRDKRAEVETFYDEIIGDLRGLLPLDRIWNATWYNAGVPMKKIREEIRAILKKAASDLNALSTVDSEFAEPVKLKYLETLDLGAALAERSRLQEQAELLRKLYAQGETGPVAGPCIPACDPVGPQVREGDTVYRLAFECLVTEGQASDLRAFLQHHSITYRRI